MKRRHDPRRGRHKRARSPETLAWEREHLLPPCPPWLERRAYRELAELRAELAGERRRLP